MHSIFAFDKGKVVRAVRDQRRRTLALLEDLPEGSWDREVVPGWGVREVAAHLASTDEAALSGRMMAMGVRQVPIEQLESWNEDQVKRWAGRPIPALLHGLQTWGRRIARALTLLPDMAANRPIPTPLGRVSPLWLGMLRVYDEWVHMEDVRRALALPSDAEAVGPVARQLLAAIPIQTLPRIGRGAVGTVALEIEGADVPRVGFDLGARRYGVGLPAATTVKADAAGLVMVAARRDRWEQLESEGGLAIEGERAPAEEFLNALLVV